MSVNWLFEHVRRTSRNRIIAAGLLAASAIGLLAYNAAYLRTVYRGPVAVQPAALAAAKSAQALPGPWIRVKVDDLKDTGIEEISVRKKHGVERSRSVSAHYYVAPVGDRLLLVKLRGSSLPTNDLVGELVGLEPGVASSLFGGASGAWLKDAVLPFELDTHDYSTEASMLWWLVGLALLGTAAYAGVAWSRHKNPSSHPALKRAAQWASLDQVAQSVQQQQAQAQNVGDWKLSPHYLLRTSALNFDLHNMDELLWAHALVTKKKVYYVIPAGQTHSLVLKWANASVSAQAKEPVVFAALQHIARYQPWVALGWSKETEQFFNKRGGGFASQIARARQQWLQSQVPAASPGPENLPTQPMNLSA